MCPAVFVTMNELSAYATSAFYENSNASLMRSQTPMKDAEDVMSTWWLRVIFVALYGAIFLIGLSGNALVVYIVARNKVRFMFSSDTD